jgi:site-specific recombinase XerD
VVSASDLLRQFFRYLVREGVIDEDPTAQIAMPKIGRSLAQSLTEDESRGATVSTGRERLNRQP